MAFVVGFFRFAASPPASEHPKVLIRLKKLRKYIAIFCGASITGFCEESELRSLTAPIPEPTGGTLGTITGDKPAVK